MRRVIAFLVIAAAVIGAAWWMAGLPGSVSAQIGDISFGAPTPVALLFAIVLFAVLYLLVRLLVMIIRLPRRTARLRAARMRRRGETAVTRTLLALAGGDGEAARREAQRGRTLLGDTPQTLLLAAYAGRQAGQQEEAEAAFKTLADRKDAAFLGLRGLIQQATARGDWDEAARLARQAEAASPGAPWLRTERKQLAIRAGAWKEVLTLAGPGDPIAVFAAAAANATTDPNEARRLAKRAWEADQSFTPAALAYAASLRSLGKETRAQVVLRTTWSRAPNPDLAEAMMATANDPLSRSRRADGLATTTPGHLESQILLARVALENGLLGEAQRYADEAVKAGTNQRRVWLLLADIAAKADNPGAQSDALIHAAAAAADPAWRCGACGTAYPAWAPSCAHCGASGQIAWGVGRATGPKLLVADGGETILP
jgi:HemY protein